MNVVRTVSVQRSNPITFVFQLGHIFKGIRNFSLSSVDHAKKLGGSIAGNKVSKIAPMMEKLKLTVETDPEKLVNYLCGSNIYKEGQDVKLKDDAEYPDWLWTTRISRPPPLEELDPNTLYYWRRIRKINFRRRNKIFKSRRTPRMVVNDFDFRGGHYALD